MKGWHEEAIAKHHSRDKFDCGDKALNEFLRHYARQSHELGGSKTFLAVDDHEGAAVLGYYTLSPASIEFARTPEVVRKRLARHDIPVFRLARLAVDLTAQGKGLGGQLLLSAGRRCLWVAREVGGVALLIDAKGPRAAAWYASFGAIPLLDNPLTLVLPLSTIERAIKSTEE